jgi:hypothetical protein
MDSLVIDDMTAMAILGGTSVMLKRSPGAVVAGLVLATPIVTAQCLILGVAGTSRATTRV